MDEWGWGGGTKSQREIWLPRESETRRLQVFTRPGQEEEEARVQICAGAGRGCGLSTTVSLGQDPGVARGKGGGREGRPELACAAQEGPTLGFGLPLLDAQPPGGEKPVGRSCLIPQLPSILGGGDETGLD